MKRYIDKLKSHAPTVDVNYRIGMRVVKTAVAVGICLLVALFTGDMESVTITSISAIVTIRATQSETVRSGIFRLLGTIIGGALGLLTVTIGLFLPYYNDGLYVVIIPLMLLLNLYLCNFLNMQDSCSISCVVTVIVAAHIIEDAAAAEALAYTLLRVKDTLVGVVVATIMNLLPFSLIGSIIKKDGKSG